MRRALAAPVLLAALVASCGGGGKPDSDSSTASVQHGRTQTTKVELVQPADDSGPRSAFHPETIYKTLAPGVVTIYSLDAGTDSSGEPRESLGSGFVVDADGDIATNAHVVTGDSGARAKDVYVSFADGNRLKAKIVGVDPDSDVALLRVDPSQLRGPAAKLVPLPLGATSELQVGDPVAAIGSPFGEQQSLSTGVVSALNRDISSLTRFRIANAIQTDAAINHGNSGGPLLSAEGKVIGINSQIRSTGGGGQGVGFAIPVEIVKRSIEQLRAKGEVSYALVGVSSVPLYPQLAARLGLRTTQGALIDQVDSGGPADKAGLRGAQSHISFLGESHIPVGGDVIVAVDGRPLRRPDDLSAVIGVHNPGDRVKLQIIRNGKRITVPVTLGARPQRGAG